MKKIVDFFNKHNVKIRSITNLIGTLLLIGAGLAFVLLVDLYVKFRPNTDKPTPISIWLFFAIIFAVGGGIFYFFGDSQKHRKVLTIVLKGIGLVLGIGYIFFVVYFLDWINTSDVLLTDSIPAANSIPIITLVVNCVGLLVLAINYTLSIIYVEQDY